MYADGHYDFTYQFNIYRATPFGQITPIQLYSSATNIDQTDKILLCLPADIKKLAIVPANKWIWFMLESITLTDVACLNNETTQYSKLWSGGQDRLYIVSIKKSEPRLNSI